MSLPQFNSGLENYYEARITTQETIYKVMCFPIDGLGLPFLIKLIKIDAEGHELSVLKGMQTLLRRDLPVLILECPTQETKDFLARFGYQEDSLPKSHNGVFVAE